MPADEEFESADGHLLGDLEHPSAPDGHGASSLCTAESLTVFQGRTFRRALSGTETPRRWRAVRLTQRLRNRNSKKSSCRRSVSVRLATAESSAYRSATVEPQTHKYMAGAGY